jgi:hypothetical protein
MFIDVKCSIDVLYQALSQRDLSGPCSIFHYNLFKVNQEFPFQAPFVFFSDSSSPLVRSFKAFLFDWCFVLTIIVCLLCMLVPDD